MTLKEIEMLILCKQYVEVQHRRLTHQLEHMCRLDKDTKNIQSEIRHIEKILNFKEN